MKPLRILFITPYVPSLIRVRPYNFIKFLARRGHRITLLSISSSAQEEQDADRLREWCQCVETVPVSRMRSLWNCVKALPQPEMPLQAVYSFSPRMQKRIRTLLREDSFDVVHVEHLRGARFRGAIRGVPCIYDSVDCITLLFEQAQRIGPSFKHRLMARLDLGRTRRYESHLADWYDHLLVTSPADKEALERLHDGRARGSITVLPNGVDLEYFAPMPIEREQDTLVFSGKMSYHSNVAAVLYLVREIMPRIWEQRPAVKLIVVGKDPPGEVRALAADERITVTGYVKDLRPYLARATVAVCPMRYGVGIQNKVLEALAMATPVVATPQACGALQAKDGRDLLIAAQAPAFAADVLRLLQDEALRRELARNGRQYVERFHNWDTIAASLENVYLEVMERWNNSH